MRTVCSESKTSHSPDGTEGFERKSTSRRQAVCRAWNAQPSKADLYASLVVDWRRGKTEVLRVMSVEQILDSHESFFVSQVWHQAVGEFVRQGQVEQLIATVILVAFGRLRLNVLAIADELIGHRRDEQVTAIEQVPPFVLSDGCRRMFRHPQRLQACNQRDMSRIERREAAAEG